MWYFFNCIKRSHRTGTMLPYEHHLGRSCHIYFIAPSPPSPLAPPTEQLGGMKDCFLPLPRRSFLRYLEEEGIQAAVTSFVTVCVQLRYHHSVYPDSIHFVSSVPVHFMPKKFLPQLAYSWAGRGLTVFIAYMYINYVKPIKRFSV